jgi:hypothetical protein
MEQGHGNPHASIVFEFPNSLIPQFLDLFRARPVEFRYADPPKAGFHRARVSYFEFECEALLPVFVVQSLQSGLVRGGLNTVKGRNSNVQIHPGSPRWV